MNAPLCHRLMDYRERSLPESERIEFEMHVAECACCQQELGAEHRLDQLLSHAVTRTIAPAGVVEPVERRLVCAPGPPRIICVLGDAAPARALGFLTMSQR